MNIILKHFKKSIVPLIIIVGLLILQASLDLTLPTYTSSIVNVGVQQSGINYSTPKYISTSELEKHFLFLTIGEQELILSHYQLLEHTSDNESLIPALKNEEIYELTSRNVTSLEELFQKTALILTTIESNEEKVKAQLLASMGPGSENVSDISIYDLLALISEEQLLSMQSQINEQFNAFPETMADQVATAYIKGLYVNLGMNTDQIQSRYILTSGAKMLGIALLSMIATVSISFFGSRVAAKLAKDLRQSVFQKVVSFANAEMKQFSTASLITRTSNDIQQIQTLVVMFLRVLFYAPIIGVGGVLKATQTNSSMAWIIALAIGVILVFVLFLFIVVIPKFNIIQKLIDKINLITREILTGLPVIRAFSTQKHERNRFDDASTQLTKVNLFVSRIMALMMPMIMFVMNAVAILILWKGAHGIDDGVMQVGDLMAYIQYTMQIIMAFLMIAMMSIFLPRAMVSIRRIIQVLNTKNSILEPTDPKKFDIKKRGIIEFKEVCFKYPDADEYILKDISFEALPGQTTAFIGSTGSGKSTLINLIPRFFDVTDGQIMVSGVNIKEVDTQSLRSHIGYIPQQGILFSGTIASNVKYGDEKIPMDRVEKAAAIAQATDFISEKEQQYDSEISQGGTNVSGGQRQRLSIARAIAMNPDIYIFDDSFSALDFKTDAKLRAALKDETTDKTVLIVAQRISTIMNAEQIIVLDEGRVVGKGTHKELINTCDVYRQIAESQLAKGEF